MGTCCVAGCSDLDIDEKAKTLTIKSKGITLKEGDFISLDGSTGKVYAGKLNTQDPSLSGNFGTLMKWSDKFRKIGVETNADTPHDAEVARKFGAGRHRTLQTEHMFFEGARIKAIREMILQKIWKLGRKLSQSFIHTRKAISRVFLKQ